MKMILKIVMFFAVAMMSVGVINVAADETKQTGKSEFRYLQDRLHHDVAIGKLTQKESVLLQARILYAYDTLPKDSPYALQPGEEISFCGTGFYKEVHQVFSELTKEEKELLKSFSPDLKAIIETREQEMMRAK